MATFNWLTLTDGQAIDPFDPVDDALNFDDEDVSAADIHFDSNEGANAIFTFGGKTVTL